jgi:hypothetical protein
MHTHPFLIQNRFTREKARSNKRLQAIADMIEEKQLWKDHALLSSIDQLVSQLFSTKRF